MDEIETYRKNVLSGASSVTAATLDENCDITNLTHSDDSVFYRMVENWAFANNQITFDVTENPTNAVREGYSTVTYVINGIECNKRTHLVQAAGDKDNMISVSVYPISIGTTPIVNFYTSNDTTHSLLSTGRYSSETHTKLSWNRQGIASKIQIIENGSHYTRMSMTIQKEGQYYVTLLNNATIPSGTPFIDLATTFNTEDYRNSDKSFMTITFR